MSSTPSEKDLFRLTVLSEAETMFRELLASEKVVDLKALNPSELTALIDTLGKDDELAVGRHLLQNILKTNGRSGLQSFVDRCSETMQKQGFLKASDLHESEISLLKAAPSRLITQKLAAGALGTGIVGVTLGSIGLAKKIGDLWTDRVQHKHPELPKTKSHPETTEPSTAPPSQSGFGATLSSLKEWLEPAMSMGVGVAALALAHREYHAARMLQVAKAVSGLRSNVQQIHQGRGRIHTM